MKIVLIPLLLIFSLNLQAHDGEDHGAAPAALIAGDGAQRLTDGSLFVPKPVQRSLAIRTLSAQSGEYPRIIEMSGRVIADPGSGGRVQATQAGIIEAGPSGLAQLGQRVSKGQVLAVLHATLDQASQADRQAALIELAAQIDVQDKRLTRLNQLEGSVPRKDLEQARIELQSLQARQAGLARAVDARIALRAPVSGVVAASQVVIGQVVEARETLFEIVDPRRIAVEALAFDPQVVNGLGRASARLGDTADGVITLDFLGAGRSLREQALPVLFRVRPPASGALPNLALGQSLKLQVETAQRHSGIAVPVESIVRNAANENMLWLHTQAERFVARRVKTQPLDAKRVLVIEGLQAGERVVTQGASLLNQVR